jgi:hypothetical protein
MSWMVGWSLAWFWLPADAITDNVLQRQYMFYEMLHDHTYYIYIYMWLHMIIYIIPNVNIIPNIWLHMIIYYLYIIIYLFAYDYLIICIASGNQTWQCKKSSRIHTASPCKRPCRRSRSGIARSPQRRALPLGSRGAKVDGELSYL